MNTLDTFTRPLKDLRISVTDRCNFRCTYCMPNVVYARIAKPEILTFEEIERLARLFVRLGVDKIRLTGGEPLLREQLDRLVAKLSVISGVTDVCLTTNGSLLAEKAAALKAAGLRRVTVSLDALDPETFRRVTPSGDLRPVLDGIFAAKRVGFAPIKINAVIERGVNDGEIVSLAAFCRDNDLVLRFIEYMDVGTVNGWSAGKMVSKREILEILSRAFPLKERDSALRKSAPAVEYEYADGRGTVGVIGSMTEPFCSDCTRARLTPDGKLVTCLFSKSGVDLKTPLRSGASDEDLLDMIRRVWQQRSDRYSEDRLKSMNSRAGYDPKTKSKLEMITLGG